MKTKYITFLAAIVLLMTGCKDEKSLDSLDVVNNGVKSAFKVTVSVNLKKSDALSLYYSTDGTNNFPANPLWREVKGSDATQDVVFELPADVKPTQIRLDFGMAKDQPDIVFSKIKCEYAGKTFESSGKDLALYFTADLTKCTFDAGTGIIKAIEKDGVRQFPSLYPQEAYLKPEFAKLTK